MKYIYRYLSIFYAELLALYYEGEVSFHHINKHGFWEFRIYGTYGTVYESKGLRKKPKS